jgi:hypothetical protein
MAESATRWHRQPGDIAAEWTARELAARETDDAQYVAEDEERLRTTQPLPDGNYPLQQTRQA